MKTANIASVRALGPSRTSPGTDETVPRVDRMADLLRRYPAIEQEDRQELLTFLTAGPPEEIVQVTYAQGLEPRFRAFRSDHPREFRTGLRGWLPMIVLVLIALLGVAWRLLFS